MATTYRVTVNPGNITVDSDSSPITVTGLTNGQSYTFTIKAINELGESKESFPAGPVLVGGVPSVPLNFTATSTTRYEIDVAFDAPADDGGLTIDVYEISVLPGYPENLVSGSPATIDSLADDVEYSVTVRAHNAKGFGPPTAPELVIPGVVPGAPTIGTATKEDDTVVAVEFTPPADDGGPPITLYTATSTPGSITGTGTSSPVFVSGLSYGETYTFHVAATNAIGEGPDSAESNEVSTQALAPDTPTITDAYGNNVGQAVVEFTAGNDNGSPITYIILRRYVGGVYQYEDFLAYSGQTQMLITSEPEIEATFRIYARNAIGDSPYSAETAGITPTGSVPQAPTSVTVAGSIGRATASWTHPDTPPYNGGYRIQGYEVTTSDGKAVSGSFITAWYPIGGGGKTCTVKAYNHLGASPASATSSTFSVTNSSIPYYPSPPTLNSASSNSTGQITVSFSPPALTGGGAGIVQYNAVAKRGGYSAVSVVGASSPLTITGLTSGAHYRVYVRAMNGTLGQYGGYSLLSADIVVQ
jgi:hypothetical protein